MRKIKHIIIHCADTYASMDIGRSEIDKWHKDRGWNGVGYHYVIRRNGIIEVGRMEQVIGAHVAGFNTNSIGICWVGGKGLDNKAEDNRTIAQVDSMRLLVKSLKIRYPDAEVVGHRDLAKGRDCPCFDVRKNL